MTFSLGIITEQLQNYGGSEVYILECIRRWQSELDIAIYTTRCNERLLEEFGVDRERVSVRLLPKLKNRKHRFDLLDDLVVRPRIWEEHVGEHDLYFQYLFPAQLVRKSPSIWFAAEPLRMLYDLRHQEARGGSKISFHVYPRMRYDSAYQADLEIVLQIIQELDRHSKIESLVTNSKMMDGYLETVYGRKSDLVAYPGINLPDEWNGPVDNKTALFVGRLWHHKRIDRIIEAISLLPQGKLIIVGDGPEKKKLKALTRKLNVVDRVRFVSSLSNLELQDMYRSVSCGVYTPTREPFGIMPVEAASYGIPVVVTEDGGYTEALDDSCAHIVPPEPQKIANALDSIFSDHANARKMGEIGRQKAANFTWDNTATTLMQLFKTTLTHQRKVIPRQGSRPLLGAHYYPWYRSGEVVRHWNENTEFATVTNLPELGIYSSDDHQTVCQHLKWVEAAGLDYLVVNLQVGAEGIDPHEMASLNLLFDTAAERLPELSLSIMLTCEEAGSEAIQSTLEIVNQHYFSRSNYLYLRSRPALWYFISESFIGHFFYHYSGFLEQNRGAHCIAASGFCYSKNLPPQYEQFFDGWSLYSPLQISKSRKWEKLWKSGYRDFLEDKQNGGFGVFTICPGYDDTGLTKLERVKSKFRKIRRMRTQTFSLMQEAAVGLARQPDLIVVTSFNEFHENTHIEPSEAFGLEYIEATKSFSDRLRSQGGMDPRKAAGPDEESLRYTRVAS